MTTELKQIPILNLAEEIDERWDEFNQAFQEVLRSGQFIMGPMVRAFEQEVAAYLGTQFALGVNSGTDALVIGLRALGIGEGDEVLTTPFSFFATAESISILGAKPVFVDIDEDTFNLDPAQLEAHLTERTRAIMPVHLYGNPAPMDEILAFASKHDLHVIEDCAQSFGARHESGQMTGTMGKIGAYSFFPTKNLGAFGDGGLIVTDDEELATTCDKLRRHGSLKKYRNEILGYNSRLDAMQAAMLRVRLPHIEAYNAGRNRVAACYNEKLAGLSGIITPRPFQGHVFHQYTIRVLGGLRDELKAFLGEHGISTMIYYPVPQDQLPVYKQTYTSCSRSATLAQEVLSLPIWPTLGEEEIGYIAGTIKAFFQDHS